MMKNARKLTYVFREHGDPFLAGEYEDEIYNLLTQEVMTEKVHEDILERNEIGQTMFMEFATERLIRSILKNAMDKIISIRQFLKPGLHFDRKSTP